MTQSLRAPRLFPRVPQIGAQDGKGEGARMGGAATPRLRRRCRISSGARGIDSLAPQRARTRRDVGRGTWRETA